MVDDSTRLCHFCVYMLGKRTRKGTDPPYQSAVIKPTMGKNYDTVLRTITKGLLLNFLLFELLQISLLNEIAIWFCKERNIEKITDNTISRSKSTKPYGMNIRLYKARVRYFQHPV